MTVLERLRDKANSLPACPGVYLMKNGDGDIIYVGKSKKLKNRVTTYFTGNRHTAKTARMVRQVEDFDYIVCDTEIEALTLENVLIKRHTPKYNIKLKDAKSYPYIKIEEGAYPRLCVTRDRAAGKGKYYGPYQGTSGAYAALEAVNRTFSLPTCKRRFPRDIGKERPCLYLQMGRCVGVCTGTVSEEDYAALIRKAQSVLRGDIRETVESLRTEMMALAEREAFERAASVRDSIAALNGLLERQKVVADAKVSRDVFALYEGEVQSVLAVLTVRSGALVGKNEFFLSDCDVSDAEDVVSLIADYYDKKADLPREVMLDFPLSQEDTALLSEYLSLESSYKIRVRTPERGEGRALCDMALENAREAERQRRLTDEREDKARGRLAELLGLSPVPRRIECYDISNLKDEAITASMVVSVDGKLSRSDYRTFHIKTTDGADDYGAMREVLSRRLSHIGDGSASLGEAPDLILLDGGATHVGVGREVLRALQLDIPVFGMVKDDYHKTRALTDGERDISIAHEMNVYTFIYKLQEETHRRAVRSTMEKKRQTLTHSTLEKINGIGAAKAKKLLARYKLGTLRSLSVEEIAAVKGISERDARAIYEYFHKEKGTKKQ